MHCILKGKMKGCNSHLKSKKCQPDIALDWIRSLPPTQILTWAKTTRHFGHDPFFLWALPETGWVSVAIQYV